MACEAGCSSGSHSTDSLSRHPQPGNFTSVQNIPRCEKHGVVAKQRFWEHEIEGRSNFSSTLWDSAYQCERRKGFFILKYTEIFTG